MRTARSRALRAALCAVALAVPACAGALTAPADQASTTQESIFQDDSRLLYSGDAVRDSTLDELKSLGVNTIRAFVTWNNIAPSPDSTTRPAFDAANPAAYPASSWDRYDGLVRAAYARGLGVIFVPTSPIPAWASQCFGSVPARRTCSPNPIEFGRFMVAMGLRYSSTYHDENQGGGALPRVFRWAIWNEPNVAIWMTPQYVRRGSFLVPASADRYRRLAYSAIGALRLAGHGGDQILLGETGPVGHTAGLLSRRPVATAEFLRAVLCIDRFGHPLRGFAAVRVGCSHPLYLAATGWSHHPYIQGGSRSPLTPARFDEITISSPYRLKLLLAQAARYHRVRRYLPLYYTEYGFQTNPPDRTLGVPLVSQSAYLAQSGFMTYRDPAVRGLAQYLLRDDTGLSGFQTGLRFVDGREKPSYDAYRFPIWVVRRGIFVTVFGQMRPVSAGARGVVRAQVRLPGSSTFTTYRTFTPNSKGFVYGSLRSRHGVWRLYWQPTDGSPPLISRVAQEATR
jgi:hypothetical protein